MTEEVKRNYLEINSLKDLKESEQPSEDYSVNLIESIDFQINKFFYKNIGKEHRWTDRLAWTDKQWMEYISNQKVNANNNESICFKELVNSIDFPHFDSKNNLDRQKLKTWIESHPNEIIISLKKAKRFDVLTEY